MKKIHLDRYAKEIEEVFEYDEAEEPSYLLLRANLTEEEFREVLKHAGYEGKWLRTEVYRGHIKKVPAGSTGRMVITSYDEPVRGSFEAMWVFG